MHLVKCHSLFLSLPRSDFDMKCTSGVFSCKIVCKRAKYKRTRWAVVNGDGFECTTRKIVRKNHYDHEYYQKRASNQFYIIIFSYSYSFSFAFPFLDRCCLCRLHFAFAFFLRRHSVFFFFSLKKHRSIQ